MLILASASQSRKKLLENCQIEFIQISSNFDETSIKEKNILNLALELSFQKANSLSKSIKKTISSRVYFSKLDDLEIKSYVDTNEPLYCAGGFALEGIGGKYIEKIEGCFSNVMGLSLPWLRENLYR